MEARSFWREWRGLLRSLRMYYGVPLQVRRLRNFYQQFIHPGDLCFDVGAHVGNRLRVFNQIGAMVIACEPQQIFYWFLSRVYGNREGVIVLKKAVGSQSGNQTMLISENAPTVSSLAQDWVKEVHKKDETFSWVNWDRKIEVEVTTLDDMIEEYGLPAFCKIDVEGFELSVLNGLSLAIPVISFEYIRSMPEDAYRCMKRLMELGDYEFNRTVIESAYFGSPGWVSIDEMIEQIRNLAADETSGDIYARLRK